MDAHYTHHLDFDFLPPEVGESSSDSGSARRLNLSDEEVLLASSNPKRRAGRKKFKETRHPVYRAKDIQKAAAEAAEAFRPAELEKKGSKVSESAAVGSENSFYMEEEEAMSGLGMPGLLADMAEGMLLPPPYCVENGYIENDMEEDADVSLWSY
ncbi:hypothetical protein FEM48_Zijuj11G0073000 [Ziziphus jujuba var. spinosa]|uniref:Uncharacterized protein n=1 Tax=Ziziphus jujuba var. spinosa TaxID=714518 RepID=A0A978UHL0_ZIZJJ|nr:hypothetical protein FEM48_Zijuj11G0073000 [Ziziphus jujuba var. spinosa]